MRAIAAVIFITLLRGQENPVTTFRTESNLVSLNVSVFDKEGHVVKGLPQSAFRVYEEEQPQEIKVFRQEDVPIALGLVIDSSASMNDKRERVNSAALAMVRASNPEDQVMVITFNDVATVAQGFTSDVKQLERSLNKTESSGETAMRDALTLGLDRLKTNTRQDKKVLLVVTDGEDNSSVVAQERLIRVAHLTNAIIYGIGILGTEPAESVARAKASMEALTLATGGRCWFPANAAETGKITPEIAHEIRNQYVIGYTPDDSKGTGFRKLRVEVNIPDLKVVTRSGYYARGQ
ncbi:MAG: VWA domain-containing protein [Candidatus Solibacter sp.]